MLRTKTGRDRSVLDDLADGIAPLCLVPLSGGRGLVALLSDRLIVSPRNGRPLLVKMSAIDSMTMDPDPYSGRVSISAAGTGLLVSLELTSKYRAFRLYKTWLGLPR